MMNVCRLVIVILNTSDIYNELKPIFAIQRRRYIKVYDIAQTCALWLISTADQSLIIFMSL